MAQRTFDPNRLTFEEGIARINDALRKTGFQVERRIVTSRDSGIEEVLGALAVDNVPPGFRKWQLPVYLNCPSQLYVTVAEPNAKASPHSHDSGDGIRFIVSGSIIYDGKELTAGDWMFIPAGTQYSFQVANLGAVMCYCYCCSCA